MRHSEVTPSDLRIMTIGLVVVALVAMLLMTFAG